MTTSRKLPLLLLATMLLIALAIELGGAGIDWTSKLPLIVLLGWAFFRRGRG